MEGVYSQKQTKKTKNDLYFQANLNYWTDELNHDILFGKIEEIEFCQKSLNVKHSMM